MYILLTVCVFLTVILVIQQLRNLLTRKRRFLGERLKETLAGTVREQYRVKRRLTFKIRNSFQNLSLPGITWGEKLQARLRSNLTKSGIPLKIEEFLIINLLTILLLPWLGIVLHNYLLAVLLGMTGLFLPTLWVGICKKRRVAKIEEQLLNVIILLSNSLRAGHSFLQSLEIVSRDTPEPLATEFGKVLREMKIGVQVEDALLNLTNRIESDDLEMVITGVLIQRQVGGNLSEVLDNIAMTIDKRIKTKAKVKSLTAQARLSAWIISILPFALGAFIFTARPDFGRVMITEPMGRLLLLVGGAMLILGILLIKKVVDIDV
jgi:tight adherence protein B